MNKAHKPNSNDEFDQRSRPYIIAELGSNHNGDMNLAKELIVQAKAAGADCVKFQSWSKDTIFSRKKYEENYFIADDYRNRTDYTLEEIVEAYSISESELLEMKLFADEVGISCTSTPFSEKELDFLVDKLDAPFIKVASMDLNNYPFLKKIAKKRRPIVLSTGLSSLSEIDMAIETIEATGNTNISILHCVATYPPEDKDVNLNNILTLKECYPDYLVGFSDHTIGTEIPIASMALGAKIIEKHFTLNKDMEGWDHKVSASYDELEIIVKAATRVSKALGSKRIKATESDLRRAEFRRSIVLNKAIEKGTVITDDMIDYKRPGTGIDPSFSEFIVGMRINKNLPYDHILTKEDLV